MQFFPPVCLAIFSCLSLFLCPHVWASELALSPFSENEEGLIFNIQGSNTVGARLAPGWVKDYLEAKGLGSVVVNKLAVENEYRVLGYKKDKTAIYVDIAAHGSSTGFKGLLKNVADLAMSSRPIKEAEVVALSERGDMLSFAAENVVAIDGLAVIVNPKNPVNNLTVETIAKIFSGEYTNWKELGGPNIGINLYARDENSGTWDTFKSLVLARQYVLSKRAKRFESNDQLSDRVSRDAGGIGFVGLASVRSAKVLGVSDGESRPLKPHPLFVATEDYPLARRLFMYVPPGLQNKYVDEFIQLAHSSKGQERVENIGFVSQKPISVPFDPGVDSPESYASIVQYGERLSVNFRFKSGSAELDNKARQDILRLAEFAKTLDGKGKRIQLIGFGDQKSTRSRELVLSQMRALAVKSALRRQNIHTETVLGFGSGLPVATNNELGKLRNQRVEVWVYDEEHHGDVQTAKADIEENNRSTILSAL